MGWERKEATQRVDRDTRRVTTRIPEELKSCEEAQEEIRTLVDEMEEKLENIEKRIELRDEKEE